MQKAIVFDCSYLQYRSFFGKKEDPLSGLAWLIDDAIERHKPDVGYAAIDHSKETWRSKLFSPYKAKRKPSPEGYSEFAEKCLDIYLGHGIKIVSIRGYEGDDIIASLCHQQQQCVWVIVSVDKDLYQLVEDNRVCLAYEDKLVRQAQVIEKFGVGPSLIPDVFGLAGDAADNIPGCSGIGIKTAGQVISQYGPLENVYQNLPKVMPERVRQLLTVGREAAFLSRTLATLKTDCEIDL